jgi:hypothetical protein
VPTVYVELRPSRNLIITKIVRNLVELVRLRALMKSVPCASPIRFHRWSRADVIDCVAQGEGPAFRGDS